jgi:hypothetical protein
VGHYHQVQIPVLAPFPRRGGPPPACAAGSGTVRGVVVTHQEEDSQSQEKRLRPLAWLFVWSLWRERNHWVHDRRAVMPVALASSVLDEARL